MKPNVSFIREKDKIFRIHRPLQPPMVGSESLLQTFQKAFDEGIIYHTELVRVYEGVGTKGKYKDMSVISYLAS